MSHLPPEAKLIFQEAIEKESPEELNRYLDSACRGDSKLRNRIEQLLQAHASAGKFLGGSASYTATIEQTLVERIGIKVGRYKLLEQIGEGGMGLVYVAEQTEPVRRRVALKIIKPGMDSRQVIARFEVERQTLAIMDHPNIAKVLDAGTTEAGLPYFVMELVKGTAITEFCDAQKLDTRERLKLFVALCHAVQHAHQKGIIHRDIKPSNVLVEIHDVLPVPKVIVFGVAKAMGQQLSDKTLYTGLAQMIGTPLYMSPEQAGQSSIDVDTRSDVYSLGVVLYELLTGHTPFESEALRRVGYDEMRRMICEVDPPRPSMRISTLEANALSTVSERRQVEPKKLTLQLQRELDWIVMKAMEKDRNRRYESASALAEEIARYLNDEQVRACPPSIAYRMKKYARRYRAPLATVSLILLTMLAATTFSIRSAYDANAARAESDQERVQTNAQKIRAEDALTTAEQKHQLAEERREKAEQLEAEAVQQRDTINRNLYISDIRLAGIDLHNSNIPRLHRKLERHVPLNGDSDNRSWEWYYLVAASQQEQTTLVGPKSQVDDVDWSPDGMRIASVGYDGVRVWDASTRLQVYENHDGKMLKRGGAWSPDSIHFA